MTEQCNGSKSHNSNSTFGSKRKLLNSCKFINLSTNWCCRRITGIFYRDVNTINCRGESCAHNCYKLPTIFIVYTSTSTLSKFFIIIQALHNECKFTSIVHPLEIFHPSNSSLIFVSYYFPLDLKFISRDI